MVKRGTTRIFEMTVPVVMEIAGAGAGGRVGSELSCISHLLVLTFISLLGQVALISSNQLRYSIASFFFF